MCHRLCGCRFEIDLVGVRISSRNGVVEVCKNGAGIAFSEEKAKAVLSADEITVVADLGQGNAAARAFGCDLTCDYVKINGDYRSLRETVKFLRKITKYSFLQADRNVIE